jgi:hypothetical protein
MSNKDTEKKSDQKKKNEINEADLDKAVGGGTRPTTPQVNPATPAGTIS